MYNLSLIVHFLRDKKVSVKLNCKYIEKFVAEDEIKAYSKRVVEVDKQLRAKTCKGGDYLGWLGLDYDRKEFERIKATAKKIQKKCSVFIVAGIGGSYLGSRAILEFLKSPRYNEFAKGTPRIYFTGRNFSASETQQLLEICENNDVCLNVISKSGKTTETSIAFRIFRDFLEKKYGKEGARERIFVTTDKEKGILKPLADKEGYETFVVPDDMGGRYSVFSAVGFLPLAVAGIDIDEMMRGADEAMKALTSSDLDKNDSYKYAVIRNIMLEKGKDIEVLVGYEPYENLFCEWWKQLFGESEGKDGKGIFPAAVLFSTDLHSMGQYIQDGQRIMFETVLAIETPDCELTIPYNEADEDELNFVANKKLYSVNKRAMRATILAHVDGGVPNLVLEIADRSERSIGYLIYFFWLTCAMSGLLLGVNPFDQPGVEAYKRNMFALIGKPGYEELKEKLKKELGD